MLQIYNKVSILSRVCNKGETVIKIAFVTFSQYLEKKFLEWQSMEGRRKTIEEFALYIGVSRPLLNMWMNGKRKPGKESLKLLSTILGNEVYDILGYERPNPYLQTINRIFERLSPEHQRKLAEDAERYETGNANAAKTSRKRKPSSNQ